MFLFSNCPDLYNRRLGIGAAYSAGIHPTVDCISDGVRETGKEEQEGLNPSNSRGLTDIIFVISQKRSLQDGVKRIEFDTFKQVEIDLFRWVILRSKKSTLGSADERYLRGTEE